MAPVRPGGARGPGWRPGDGRESTVFFFQAEDGIRDYKVTGVQTCALPIFVRRHPAGLAEFAAQEILALVGPPGFDLAVAHMDSGGQRLHGGVRDVGRVVVEIGRASGRERGEISVGAGSLKKKKEKVCRVKR